MSLGCSKTGLLLLLASPVVLSGVLSSSSISVASSMNPSVYGQPVTLTAAISPSAATGNVTFYDGTTVLGIAKVSNGQASLTTSLLAAGSRSLKAYYGGDVNRAASTSAILVETVNAVPSAGFAAAGNYGAAPNPKPGVYYSTFLAAGDFNGDGDSDLVVSNYSGNNVSVLLGNGDGSFKAAVNYAAGTQPTAVAVGDFNGDGNTDIVVADLSGGVSVLLGNSNGTFKPAVNYGTSANEPISIVVADFNNDGKDDVAVVGSFGGSLLFGSGDGTFQAAINFDAGGEPTSVAVGDLNRDGKADIVVTQGFSDAITVSLGNGDGTFQTPISYGGGSYQFVAVGDFNADGKLDLAGASNQGVSVLLGNGDGTFSPAVNYKAGYYPSSIVVGDFNGDGILDIGAFDGQYVSVLIGNGDGTFLGAVSFTPEGGLNPLQSSIVVGEFNRDGRSDLAFSNPSVNNVSIFVGVSSTSSATSLSSMPASSVPFGQSVSLMAAVTAVNGFPFPTGMVRFRDGSMTIGTVSLFSGLASFTATNLASGPHSFYADYLGDSLRSGSTSSAMKLTVTGGPQWSIAKSHSGTFAQGQTAAAYMISVANNGVLPTRGTVTVTEMPPSGMTLASISGPGWTCSGQTCTRSEGLIPGSSFPAIMVMVNIAASAATPLINQATISGGGAGLTIASDSTVIKSAPPFGSIDTPAPIVTGVSGAIGITGWALSGVGVQNVALSREPIGGEPVAANGLVFLVNAATIQGARPDVAIAYPGYPGNNSGWGAQILTNELPNGGNGTYRVHAIVTDNAGQAVDLGVRSISANNSQAVLPFGTIDTPTQGGTVMGTAFVNFGWALTPVVSNVIPKDGSTIWVYIDNNPAGHPVYNNYRSDIANLFPGLQNSSGAIGYFIIDSTKLANGLHTISWNVQDSAGKAQGIGSRFFTVSN